MEQPRAGTHYPRSVGEFQAWFRTDRDCLDYLEWLRWPTGFACPDCGYYGGWRLGDGRFMCPGCGGRTSVTAGTIFDRTRTPLTVWFTACWLFTTGKDGISALSLKRMLEIGSYQTAWAMLHRLRSILVRPGRDRLVGAVEVDETYIGGFESGLSGGRAPGKKVLTGIAVEVREPRGFGRCRMQPLADLSAASLHAFVKDHVEPGARVITDAWQGYRGWTSSATCTSGAASGPSGPVARTLASYCPRRTGSPRWPSGGCWEPTRDRLIALIWSATSMSSYSVSTAAAPAAAEWCSTGFSSSPSPTPRCATSTSSPSSGLGRGRPRRRQRADTRRASSARQRTARGELLASVTPVKWIPQSGVIRQTLQPKSVPMSVPHATSGQDYGTSYPFSF